MKQNIHQLDTLLSDLNSERERERDLSIDRCEYTIFYIIFCLHQDTFSKTQFFVCFHLCISTTYGSVLERKYSGPKNENVLQKFHLKNSSWCTCKNMIDWHFIQLISKL